MLKDSILINGCKLIIQCWLSRSTLGVALLVFTVGLTIVKPLLSQQAASWTPSPDLENTRYNSLSISTDQSSWLMVPCQCQSQN